MTIGLIVKLKIVPNKNQEFETAFKQLAEIVNTTEDGCLLYVLHQSRDDAQTYVVLEQYTDEQALKAHSKTAHYQEFGKNASAFLAAAPHIELMDSV
jgi:quinol monooxygenase YgiN